MFKLPPPLHQRMLKNAILNFHFDRRSAILNVLLEWEVGGIWETGVDSNKAPLDDV